MFITPQELRETRQQCTALREQLQGLLAATAAAGQVDDKETEEKLKAAEAEKQALVDEQNKMKEEFEKWKEQYRQDHEGEEPSEEDRFVMLVNTNCNSIDFSLASGTRLSHDKYTWTLHIA